MLRLILAALTVTTSLAAVASVFFTAREGVDTIWSLGQLAAAATVLGCGLYTMAYTAGRLPRSLAVPDTPERLLLIVGAGLVVLGGEAMVRPLHIAALTGDPEYWVMVLGGLLGMQGLATMRLGWIGQGDSRVNPAGPAVTG